MLRFALVWTKVNFSMTETGCKQCLTLFANTWVPCCVVSLSISLPPGVGSLFLLPLIFSTADSVDLKGTICQPKCGSAAGGLCHLRFRGWRRHSTEPLAETHRWRQAPAREWWGPRWSSDAAIVPRYFLVVVVFVFAPPPNLFMEIIRNDSMINYLIKSLTNTLS